ncbi:MAG: hypothetical protein PVJ86_13470 [Phycisphaerales bacterium]|jgi:hypothetical protein
MGIGVLYVAFGQKAWQECVFAIETLKKHHNWPIAVIGDKSVPETHHIKFADIGTPGRFAKVNLYNLSPFSLTLYLDADTRVYGDLSAGFRALEAGWDMAIVPSAKQGEEAFHHLSGEEQAVTLDEIGTPLQLNTGVMWFVKNRRTKRLWVMWRKEWLRFKDKDQGALHRALVKAPVRVWLMGRAYNGGRIVAHRFGGCKG